MSLSRPNVGGDPSFNCENCDQEYQLKQLSENDGTYSCPECGEEIYSTNA